MKKLFVLSSIFLLSISSIFATDLIILANGKAFQGEILKINNQDLKFKNEKRIFKIPISDIAEVVFEEDLNSICSDFYGPDKDKCLLGSADASLYHGRTAAYFVGGLIVGPLAIIGAYLEPAIPSQGKSTLMMSENHDLFSDPVYLMCYKKQARAKMAGASLLGWGTAIILIITLGS